MSSELYSNGSETGGREVAGGVLLITGSVLGVLLMSHHPTGHDLAADLDHQALVNKLVHGTAVLMLPMMLLGLCALRRRLGPSTPTDAAIVVYGFVALAWTIAAVASGFLQTELFTRMHGAEDGRRELFGLLSEYTHMINQSFADMGVVASSITIGLLSWSMWRTRRMPRALGVAGGVVALSVLVARLSGHIDLDVHGFGMIVLAQSAFYLLVGILLMRGSRP